LKKGNGIFFSISVIVMTAKFAGLNIHGFLKKNGIIAKFKPFVNKTTTMQTTVQYIEYLDSLIKVLAIRQPNRLTELWFGLITDQTNTFVYYKRK